MSVRVSKSQFKARVLELFRHVERSGAALVVTDRGQPVIEVRPYTAFSRSPLEVLKGTVLRYDNPTAPVGEDDWEVLC